MFKIKSGSLVYTLVHPTVVAGRPARVRKPPIQLIILATVIPVSASDERRSSKTSFV